VSIRVVTESRMYGVLTDAAGVQYVVRYALTSDGGDLP
jgi:hypothetical protein